MSNLIELDGAIGGGQILRSGLSLSMVTGKSMHIRNIRVGRSKPGLGKQHLCSVLAAAEVCGATVEGAELGSLDLIFEPGPIKAAEYKFDIGSAGSCSLVLQTVLPALLYAPSASSVEIRGATHNPLAPTFEFLSEVFLPLLGRMGATVDLELVQHGFVPRGGGCIRASIEPARLEQLHLGERGAIREAGATALVTGIPSDIGQSLVEPLVSALNLEGRVEKLDYRDGSGKAVLVRYRCDNLSMVFSESGIGRRQDPAQFAEGVVRQAQQWLASGAVADEHLGDQLLLPMALAGGGSFTTTNRSEHLESNQVVIEKFLDVDVKFEDIQSDGNFVKVTLAARGAAAAAATAASATLTTPRRPLDDP